MPEEPTHNPAGSSSSLSLGVELLRRRLRRRALRPLEDLSGREPDGRDVLAVASDVLSRGWEGGVYPPVRLASGAIPWTESLALSRTWSFHLHSWDPLDPLLFAYSTTLDRELLERSVAVAIEWIDLFSDGKRHHPFAWYDMAVGLRAARLAFIIDGYGRLDDPRIDLLKRLLASVFKHRDLLADDDFIRCHTNHGFFQAAGQAAMGKRLTCLPGMKDAFEQASERLSLILKQQFTPEGIHKEHSPDYHRMVLRTLDSAIRGGLVESLGDLAEHYAHLENALSWFVFPDGVIVNFGDSDARDLAMRPTAARRNWKTERMRWVISAGRAGSNTNGGSRAFQSSGYFVVRTPSAPEASPRLDSYMAFNAAFHSRTHKHGDDLSFVLYENGEPVLIDAGRYGYLGSLSKDSALWERGFWYSDPHRVYVESTRAHNCVEIDGQSYDRKRRRPYGSALMRHGCTEGVYFCEGHVYHQRSIRHARVLAYRPRDWLVVFDWLWDNLKKPHSFAQYFNLGPAFSVESDLSTPDRLVLQGRDNRVSMTSLVPDVAPFDLARGQTSPELAGWWSPSERELEPVLQARLQASEPGFSFAFATLIALNALPTAERQTTRIARSGQQIYLRWTDERASHRLRLRRPVDQFSLEYTRAEPSPEPDCEANGD